MEFQIDRTLNSTYLLMIPHSWLQITALRSPRMNFSTSLLNNWFTKWRVSFNLNKTIAVLSTQHWHRLHELRLFNHSAHWSRRIKYLGITSDCKLLWNENVNDIAIKALVRISLLGYHSKLLSCHQLHLYTTCIRPVICSIVKSEPIHTSLKSINFRRYKADSHVQISQFSSWLNTSNF
jgi:hypothetical protein